MIIRIARFISVALLQKGQDVAHFLTGESGAHAHVRHRGPPLIVPQLFGIAHVVATRAVVRPGLGAARKLRR